MMDGEISNLMVVWSMVAATMCYCYKIGNTIPKGKGRLTGMLPAIVILLVLPMRLNSVHLGGPSSFFIGWLSTFKLLLFAFGKGPLSSNPPLSLSQFVPLACLPIKLQISNHNTPNSQDETQQGAGLHKSPLSYAFTAVIMISTALVPLYTDKAESVHPKLVLILYCLHLYIGLEFIYWVISTLTTRLLKVQLEPQFHQPYFSTSLQDFWGRRWNIMVNRVLHPTVYQPVVTASTRLLGRKWASIPAILATFSVSALMHELVFYYIKRENRTWESWEPSWDATCFFLLHGACLAIELAIKKELKEREKKWRMPMLLSRLLTVAFVFYTALLLFVPALVRCRFHEKAARELDALIKFAKEVCAVLKVWLF